MNEEPKIVKVFGKPKTIIITDQSSKSDDIFRSNPYSKYRLSQSIELFDISEKQNTRKSVRVPDNPLQATLKYPKFYSLTEDEGNVTWTMEE